MNIKRLAIIFLPAFFIASFVLAKTIVINPKDVPGWENFTARELKIMQKEYVDEGHQPWRSDPAAYAKLFMKCYYPKLDVNQMEIVPAKVILKDNNAIIKITYHNTEHVICLHKAFPHNPESIWIVDKMNIGH